MYTNTITNTVKTDRSDTREACKRARTVYKKAKAIKNIAKAAYRSARAVALGMDYHQHAIDASAKEIAVAAKKEYKIASATAFDAECDYTLSLCRSENT